MLLQDIKININHLYKDCFKKGESILPHKWRIRAVSKIIHEYANKIVPMRHYIGMIGKVVEYQNIPKVTTLIFTRFKLDHVAKERSVDLSSTCDGFQLTNQLSFVMGGVKMVDPNSVNPRTGNKDLCPLYHKYLPQTQNLSFLYKLVMGKETELMYKEEFNSIFDMFYEASLEEQTIFPGWKPILYSHSCDMSVQQKSLGFGGASKVKK